MALKHSYLLGLIMSTAFAYACDEEDPNYIDSGSPIMGVTGGNTAGGNTAGGNTAGGLTAGGNTAGGLTAGGNTAGGNTAGGNTAGGLTAGGLTAGGNTAGGNMAGGNTAGGNMAGGNTAGGNTGDGGTDAGTPPRDGGGDSGPSTGSDGGPPVSSGGCTPAPTGTFQTRVVTGTGPGGNYTIHRPTTLGENGFVHPPIAWGNGLATVPGDYTETLNKLASNGFVVIANPGTGSDPQVVRQGLEWLLMQNSSGEYMGKLAVNCAGTIGYSMGGGAAVGAGAHPAVKAVVSIHGLQDAAENVKGPLLLTTSTGDSFVTKEAFVQPCYDRSRTQPTMMITHSPNGEVLLFGDHLEPLGGGGHDTEPAIAWLRLWLYGDQAQKAWFYGANCKACTTPWMMPARKNHSWD
jgi:hypothetical protein